jgi:hypothetical protein
MKKLIFLTVSMFSLISCSSDSSSEDLNGKVFYGVATASCFPTKLTNLSPNEYVLMSFVDEDGNDVSYQPKPNTWYRMDFSGQWVKTGINVTPQDSPLSFGFLPIEYKAPCQ